MGHRTVKRVPMDFQWEGIWKGYLNPFQSSECKACEGSGYNPETKQIAEDWYDHAGFGVTWGYVYYTSPDGKPADRPPWKTWGTSSRWENALTQDEVDALIAAGRLIDYTHDFVSGKGWQPKDPAPVVTAEMVNRREAGGLGHDAINRHICVETRAKRLGVYGLCFQCEGEGEVWASPEIKQQHEEWQQYEPPTGEGWQLWETCSEGSPVSPVFATAEELAAWCVTGATIFADSRSTYEEWLGMFKGGEDAVEMGSMFIVDTGRGVMGAAVHVLEKGDS